MAELISQSPWVLAARGEGNGVIARAIDGRAVATVMLRKGQRTALADRVQQCFGIALRDQAKRATADGVTFLGIGPGRWLAMAERPGFVDDLTAKLAGLASVVEQSDALAILRLSGLALPATLEKGFAIDTAGFACDDCAVTSVSHQGATIWKIDDTPSFEIAVARSLAGSFLHWLEASAAVHGLAIDRG